MRRINQRKGLCFVQEFSADQNDQDDKDDEYDSVFFMMGMLKICVTLIKEKGMALFRNPVPMRTIRTMI